jgi:thioredoxin reductase
MKRRQFIKNTTLGGAASLLMPSNIFSIISKQNEKIVVWEGSPLPLVFDIDVLVIGGSFCGLSAAVNFANAGKKVAIIDSKTFLGDEITSYLNFSLDLQDTTYPEPIEICKEYSVIRKGHRYVKNDDVKREMETMLEKFKIPLLYNTLPIHITNDGSGQLVVMANKSGFQLVKSKIIIDCTPTSVTRYLTGDTGSLQFGENVSIVVEMYGTGKVVNGILRVPDYLKVNNNQLYVSPGYLNDGHLFFQFSCKLLEKSGQTDIRKLNKAAAEMQIKAYEVVKYLVNNVPEFAGAVYLRLSYQAKYDYVKEKPVTPSWADNSFLNKEFIIRDKSYEVNDFAGRYPGTWILPAHKFDYSAIISALAGDQLSKVLSAYMPPDNIFHAENKTEYEDKMLHISHSDSRYEGKDYRRFKVNSFGMPLLDEYQVIVAGGGTSGATAGATAGKEGLKTLILDGNNGLGGTGTFGGVNDYYNGRNKGFTKEIDNLVVQAEKEIKHQRIPLNRWNFEVKNYVLIKEAKAGNADMIFHSLVVGAIMNGSEVKGIVVATPYGALAFTSNLIIDATGDGDVAAFAGAEYVYGSATNALTLYSSFGWLNTSGKFNTRFDYLVDIRNITDITRTIIANRRVDKEKHPYDHATYLTLRESRHIRGDVTISLTDLLTHKQWSDVVNIHFSNVDITGHHSSDWLRLGLLPPNIEVEIPLSALTPKGLENILVVGKAFSAKHDVFPALRMQHDLENLGGVAALICSLAIRSKRSLRKIDIRELQKRLVLKDILPDEIAGRKVALYKYNIENIPLLVSQLDGNKLLQLYSDVDPSSVFKEYLPFVELCLLRKNDKTVHVLENSMAENDGNKKMLLAKALAFNGSKAAAEVIANQIKENLKHGVLPELTEKISHAAPSIMLPNQAAMPETAYLLNALAMCRHKSSIEIWRKIVDILNTTEIDLKNTAKGIFYYIDAICYGAELLGDKEAIPIFDDLHQNPLFNRHFSGTTLGMDPIEERKAILELEIGTALARSGSKKGYEILIDYLDDSRAILGDYAHNSLKRIQNEDFKKNKDMWKQWLERIKDQISPSPIQERVDG